MSAALPTPTSRIAFGLGFAAFVIGGTLLLLAWLQKRQEAEDQRLFEKLSRQTAALVQQMKLPRTEKLAHDLERLTAHRVTFRDATSHEAFLAADDAVTILLDGAHEVVFTRSQPRVMLTLSDPATLRALIVFWGLAGILGWLFARERGQRLQNERLAMLGRVATSLAHDIQNPLASIQLHAQLMQPGSAEDSQAQRHIQNESEVISGLVNQWLHLANPRPPVQIPLDVTECLRKVLQNITPQATHAGVQIGDRLQSPCQIKGDAKRLSQAFRNLLINAIQAMPTGGTLTLEQQGHLYRIIDTGTGFSSEALARSTELFYSEKEGGMGLGLNIAADLIAAHGGTLKIENHTQPHGASITVTFPPQA